MLYRQAIIIRLNLSRMMDSWIYKIYIQNEINRNLPPLPGPKLVKIILET